MALIHHIENLRAKPHHVRERIAFGTSAGITAVVAVVWVTTLAATGTFSLAPSSGTFGSGNSVQDAQQAVADTQNGFTQLVGAAGAALGATSSPAALRIVNNGTTSSLETKKTATANSGNTTVIPF